MAVGGMNQAQATQTLNQFTRAANNASFDNSRIVMSGNKQLGPVKAFCSGKADRQATINKFQQALTAKFGQQIGDMATARLDNLRSSGKALTAGMIHTIMTESRAAQADLQRLNGPMAAAHMSSPEFRTEMDNAFEVSGLPAEQKDNFVSTLKASVMSMANNTDNKMIMPQDIRAHVANVTEFCQKSYEIIQNDGDTLKHYTDLTPRIPEHNKADMAMLMATCAGAGKENQLAMSFVLEKLDDMRAAQPNGALTPETIWNACMPDQEMPEGFGQPLSNLGKDLENAMFSDFEGKGATVLVGLGVSCGMKYDAAVELDLNKGPVTMESCHSLPQLGFGGMADANMDTAETQLGIDLKRMGLEEGGLHSNFSFSSPAGNKTIDINDTSHMQGDDLTAYQNGGKSSITADIKNQVSQMCGNGKQAVTVMYSMSQSGLALMRNLSSFTGAPKSEHAAMNIDVAKQENGDIRMTFTRPDGHGLAGGFQYDVHQDGTSTLNALNFYPEPQAANVQDA